MAFGFVLHFVVVVVFLWWWFGSGIFFFLPRRKGGIACANPCKERAGNYPWSEPA